MQALDATNTNTHQHHHLLLLYCYSSQSGNESSISGRDNTAPGGYNRQNTYQRTISNDSTKPGSATGSSSDEPPNTSEKE